MTDKETGVERDGRPHRVSQVTGGGVSTGIHTSSPFPRPLLVRGRSDGSVSSQGEQMHPRRP